MKNKFTILFIILSIFWQKSLAQEVEENSTSLKLGYGFAGNDIQSNGHDIQFGIQIHQKKHVISFTVDRGKYWEYIPYQSDKETLYRSYNLDCTYGLNYVKNFFVAEFGTGIGMIGTQSQRRIDCKTQSGGISGKPCFQQFDYFKVNLPAFICISLKAKHVGFFFQTKYNFSFPRIDYRHTFGLRFDISSE